MTTKTYLIIGATRGIGLEFVTQLLARKDTYVIATARDSRTAGLLISAMAPYKDRCNLLRCDLLNDMSFKVYYSGIGTW